MLTPAPSDPSPYEQFAAPRGTTTTRCLLAPCRKPVRAAASVHRPNGSAQEALARNGWLTDAAENVTPPRDCSDQYEETCETCWRIWLSVGGVPPAPAGVTMATVSSWLPGVYAVDAAASTWTESRASGAAVVGFVVGVVLVVVVLVFVVVVFVVVAARRRVASRVRSVELGLTVTRTVAPEVTLSTSAPATGTYSPVAVRSPVWTVGPSTTRRTSPVAWSPAAAGSDDKNDDDDDNDDDDNDGDDVDNDVESACAGPANVLRGMESPTFPSLGPGAHPCAPLSPCPSAWGTGRRDELGPTQGGVGCIPFWWRPNLRGAGRVYVSGCPNVT